MHLRSVTQTQRVDTSKRCGHVTCTLMKMTWILMLEQILLHMGNREICIRYLEEIVNQRTSRKQIYTAINGLRQFSYSQQDENCEGSMFGWWSFQHELRGSWKPKWHNLNKLIINYDTRRTSHKFFVFVTHDFAFINDNKSMTSLLLFFLLFFFFFFFLFLRGGHCFKFNKKLLNLKQWPPLLICRPQCLFSSSVHTK